MEFTEIIPIILEYHLFEKHTFSMFLIFDNEKKIFACLFLKKNCI